MQHLPIKNIKKLFSDENIQAHLSPEGQALEGRDGLAYPDISN